MPIMKKLGRGNQDRSPWPPASKWQGRIGKLSGEGNKKIDETVGESGTEITILEGEIEGLDCQLFERRKAQSS